MIRVIQCVLADLQVVLNQAKRDGADLIGLYSADNINFVAVVEGDYGADERDGDEDGPW